MRTVLAVAVVFVFALIFTGHMPFLGFTGRRLPAPIIPITINQAPAATPVPSTAAAPLMLSDDEPPGTVNRASYDEQVTGHTATGIPTYTGPRGGHYHLSPSGKKVYEKHR
jgi:hypothetical protein